MSGTLVVINPRRVAVILDKQARRGAVLPLDLIDEVVEAAMKANLEKWLSGAFQYGWADGSSLRPFGSQN